MPDIRTVLVLGNTSLMAGTAVHHLEANSSADVLNCGTSAHRAALILGTEPVDAVLVFSDADDEFLDEDLEALIDRAATHSCPVLVNGASEEQKGRLEEKGADVLRVMTRKATLDRLWGELDRAAGVEREQKPPR